MRNRKNNTDSDITNQSELSLEKLRKYPGFEDVSEEEAKEHIQIIKALARVLFYGYKNKKK